MMDVWDYLRAIIEGPHPPEVEDRIAALFALRETEPEQATVNANATLTALWVALEPV